MPSTIYVNPGTGNDSGAGSQSAPFKTIANALKKATSDTTIQLATGTYNATSGEVFPLTIPSGVIIVGNEANKGSGILIEGSGKYISPTLAEQNVTLLLVNDTELRGVSVTNPARSGTAVWIESTAPTVANCTFSKSKREGVFLSGTANPVILNNVFVENEGNGISIAKNSKGEIRGNTCKKTGYGISIDDNAAPLVVDNKVSENRVGIIITGEAKPVLRNNISERNTDDGVTVITNAIPDLGSSSQPGGNILRYNGQFDLQNISSAKLVVAGNQIDPKRVKGSVELLNNEVPPADTTGGGGTGDDTAIALKDIKGHWAETFIKELVKQGIVKGFPDNTFKPDASMTRAEYAALLTKAFNPTAKRAALTFKDVPEKFWGFNAIQQAYRGEFVSGFPDKTFKPTQNVQRVQVIVSLVNGLGLKGGVETALTAYDDRAKIPDYAKDEVATGTKKRMVVNYPKLKQLNPTRDATRAEVAAMVYQALVDGGRVAAIDSPYIVG